MHADPWLKRRKQKGAKEKKMSSRKKKAERHRKERSVDDDDFDDIDRECDRALDEARRKAAAAALRQSPAVLSIFRNTV